jgi:nucleotide-binding universal stress UspA family protein
MLVGDDRSPSADVAWGWVCAQRWPTWCADVVTVTPPGHTLADLYSHEPLHEWDPEQRRTAPPDSRLTAVRHLTTAGDPRTVLGEEADVDLVVIGPRGNGLLKGLHIGSTADWLLRCPGPPLVIARDDNPVQRVLACVDGSGLADAAVAALARLPWVDDLDVEVVLVDEGVEGQEQHARQAAATLGAQGARVTITVLPPNPFVAASNPRYQILQALERTQPDLLVLGTRGLSGLARMLVGSVASTVAREASCSVLLARGT